MQHKALPPVWIFDVRILVERVPLQAKNRLESSRVYHSVMELVSHLIFLFCNFFVEKYFYFIVFSCNFLIFSTV